MGVPLAQLIFGARADLGLILLPIMFYHPFQLFVCGLLANRFATETGSQISDQADSLERKSVGSKFRTETDSNRIHLQAPGRQAQALPCPRSGTQVVSNSEQQTL
jgi:hypothetical protein